MNEKYTRNFIIKVSEHMPTKLPKPQKKKIDYPIIHVNCGIWEAW
ncbi:hypothetical protein [Methanobrevibacter sp.]